MSMEMTHLQLQQSVKNMTEKRVKAMVVEVFGSEEAAKESAGRIYKCAKAMFDRGFSTRGKQKLMIDELRPVPFDAIIGDLDKIPETHYQAMQALDAQFRLARFPKLTIKEDEQQD